jgi:F-box domain
MSDEEHKMHQQLWANLHGDVLEEVAMHIPIIDLFSASLVSHEWRRAVHSSLLCRPCQRPWLILRDLCNPKLSAFAIHALDPYSRSWISITRHSVSEKPFEMVGPCFLRGPKGDRLCALMFHKMVIDTFSVKISSLITQFLRHDEVNFAYLIPFDQAISKDPFGARWEQDMKAPRMFRLDPVVAEVGRWVLVLGGECSIERDYEEEGSVEVYDRQTGVWETARLMPAVFQGSTCATWLSVAATGKRLYAMERKTGWLSWFDPESKRWGPVRQVGPDSAVRAWAITGGSSEKLLLVGVGRASAGAEEHGEVVKVRLWEVEGDNPWEVDSEWEEMPREMVDRLFPSEKGGDSTWRGHSVDVCGTENGGYVCNPSEMRNGVVMFDLATARKRKGEKRGRIVEGWEWVPLPERVGENPMGRILCGCAPVRSHDVFLV